MSLSRQVTLLAILLCLCGPAAAAPTPPDVECEACVVADGRGRIMWARDASDPLPNASTTKMLTALVAHEETDPEEEVTVSAEAAATPDGYLALEVGETLTVDDLLHGLLLASSNDAAVALAEHVAGTEEAFVAKMNRRARALGARDTNFETPHGLDTPGHASSARDLALLGAALLAEPALAEIVATTSHTLASGERITNSNPLLEGYTGATGVKTGATLEAGEVLVASASRGGWDVIAVAMGSADASADASALLDYGFELARRRSPATVIRDIVRDIVAQAEDISAAVGS